MRYVMDRNALPSQYPTHRHEAAFWEALGRAVATFGFLEEVLGKAIFSFIATRPYNEEEIQEAYEQWRSKLERALTDQLGRLIKNYGDAVRDHPGATVTNLDKLLADLRKASEIRNVLCHGSWRAPDSQGCAVPFFINNKKQVFESPVDINYLKRVQREVASLAATVIDTVTHMGWQFPGSAGPDKVIWER